MNIFEKWQEGYCAGSPIPLKFREEFTKEIEGILEKLQKSEYAQYKPILLNDIPDVLYRVISGQYNEAENHYGLYYSFSRNPNGIIHFSEYNKYLNSDITLILAKPVDALNFVELVGRGSRYDEENEIVSKITKNSIIETKHFNTLTELKQYLLIKKGE